jgi:hypothetical protein
LQGSQVLLGSLNFWGVATAQKFSDCPRSSRFEVLVGGPETSTADKCRIAIHRDEHDPDGGVSADTTLSVMDEAPDPFSMPLKLRRELLSEGWHDRGIAEELRAKRWTRPRRGAYVDTASWGVLDDAGRHVVITRAVVRQADTEVIVSHSAQSRGGPAPRGDSISGMSTRPVETGSPAARRPVSTSTVA